MLCCVLDRDKNAAINTVGTFGEISRAADRNSSPTTDCPPSIRRNC